MKFSFTVFPYSLPNLAGSDFLRNSTKNNLESKQEKLNLVLILLPS